MYKEEEELIDFISKKKWNGKHTIEYEDVCGGPGLAKTCYFLLLIRDQIIACL